MANPTDSYDIWIERDELAMICVNGYGSASVWLRREVSPDVWEEWESVL